MGRQDVLAQLNDYYRISIYENELIHPDLSTIADSRANSRMIREKIRPMTANNS